VSDLEVMARVESFRRQEETKMPFMMMVPRGNVHGRLKVRYPYSHGKEGGL
jgi:hypothetical protein